MTPEPHWWKSLRKPLSKTVARRRREQTRPKNYWGKVNWLRVLATGAGAAAAWAAGIPPELIPFLSAQAALRGVTDGAVTDEDAEQLEAAQAQIGLHAAKFLKSDADNSPPSRIHQLRDDFEKTLEEMEITLVVFVDDLDRL